MYQRRKGLPLFLSSLLIALLAILPGCGGGGSSPEKKNTEISAARTGVAVDPYIVGAVFEEIPAGGGPAIQESTPSNERGEFVFALPLTEGSTLRMKEGAQGMHNGLAYDSILKRVVEGDGLQVVSPLTTLLANGIGAEELLSVLADAGLPNLQISDLRVDPMARMENAAILTSEALLPLQANIAVNQLFTLAGNSDLVFEDLMSRRDELAEMVELAQSAVSRESFETILDSDHLSLVGGAGAISRDHAIQALVSIIDSVVAQKIADPALDAVAEAAALLADAADLALIIFVKENRGDVSVEEGIAAGVLPDVQEEDTVYLELAKWKWKSPPVADAGPDQSVTTGNLVNLDGSRSTDPDHRDDTLTFQWSFSSRPQGSTATLNGGTTVNPTFTADVEGTYRINLVVFDNWGGASAPSTVTVTATGSVLSAPGVIQFDSSKYSVKKSEKRVKIFIDRVHGSTGEVTVEWRTLADTAAFDQDYASFNWTPVTFAPGENRKEVGVDIIDNKNSSGDKTFNVLLRNPTGGAALGTPDSAVVTIVDDGTASEPKTSEPTTSEPAPAPIISGPVRVFPGAEGFGTNSRAGRGGQIIKVTNLNDSGPGSLRAAIDASGARIIVFEVGGTISLSSDLNIRNPFVTIAGQTAPSPGIMLRNAGIRVNTNDVLIQHLRIRVGDGPTGPSPSNRDALQILGPNSYNVVVDHISASWAIDENVSTWYNGLRDVTISNSIVSEALHRSLHSKGAHSMGVLVGDYAKNISLIGNLLAHNNERNPLLKGGTSTVVVNNVFYNPGPWEFFNIVDDYGAGASSASVVGNVWLKGPSTTATVAIKVSSRMPSGTRVHHRDNIVSPGLSLSSIPSGYVVSTPPVWVSPLTVRSANTVENHVLSFAGARPADRDAVDKRIATEVKNRTGRIIDSQSQVGGWPNLPQTYRAFNIPNNPHGDDSGNGYTNIEEVLYRMALEVEGRL
jgi:hypothetical protein